MSLAAPAPLMKACGWGRIVNRGSALVFVGVVGQTHSVSAKAGIVGFTRSLAMEVGDYGVTGNIVAHGLTVAEALLSNMPQEPIKA